MRIVAIAVNVNVIGSPPISGGLHKKAQGKWQLIPKA
jgi:hypothetical protein